MNWLNRIIVIPIFILLSIILLAFARGYEIHLPLLMGSLKPSYGPKRRVEVIKQGADQGSIESNPASVTNSPSEKRLQAPATTPPIIVVVNMIKDSVGDCKVQSIQQGEEVIHSPSSSTINNTVELTVPAPPAICNVDENDIEIVS